MSVEHLTQHFGNNEPYCYACREPIVKDDLVFIWRPEFAPTRLLWYHLDCAPEEEAREVRDAL